MPRQNDTKGAPAGIGARPGKGWLVLCLLPTVLIAGVAVSETPKPGPTGGEIFSAQCAKCHGANGEGVEDWYPDPLHGDRSLEDLTKIVNDSMPEDVPEKCTGDDARKVAQYIYNTFYTAEARARNKPPRIELSRLTARQYLNVAADLVGSFVGQGTPGDKRGIEGQYFSARNFRRDKRASERLDGQIDFDFDEGSPRTGKIGNEEFAIRWQGSLIAEETGDYGFCVETENGARLWVNDNQTPLIDAWVQSGDQTEHRGTVRLLGGRVYPIRLEFFKFKQKTASVALRWRPPQRAEEVVPRRNLSPSSCPPVLVVETDFPAEATAGYEGGTSVSPEWYRASTSAAIEIAGRVVDHLETLANVKADAADRKERLQEFCYRFAERAFRRPLSEEQKRFFVDAHFDGEGDPADAVKRAIILALTSPRFLYLGIEGNDLDDYTVASRLSFDLWDSLPDDELLQAAADGKLRTPEQVAAQARRMLDDSRAKSKLRDFFHHWLHLDRAADISKDKELYPKFNEAVLSDLKTSLDLFLDDVIWSEASDYRQLLLSGDLFLNRRLADFYDVDLPPDDGFHKVALDPAERAGLLTHPLVATNFAYYKSSSPIHRGVFLMRSVLGRSLNPPPMAVTPLDEDFDPEMTTRQRVAFQTKPVACQACHSMINPLGFALERYDAVGRYRREEKGKPVDASGSYKTLAGETVRFDGARQLAEFLANSDESHRAFIRQLFHHMVKHPPAAYGPDCIELLHDQFVQDDFNIRNLLVEIVKISALKTNMP